MTLNKYLFQTSLQTDICFKTYDINYKISHSHLTKQSNKARSNLFICDNIKLPLNFVFNYKTNWLDGLMSLLISCRQVESYTRSWRLTQVVYIQALCYWGSHWFIPRVEISSILLRMRMKRQTFFSYQSFCDIEPRAFWSWIHCSQRFLIG